MFINLLNHSTYSIMESGLSIDDIINYSIINKQKYACLVDRNNMFGFMEFYTKCLKNNLVPIVGINIKYEEHEYVLIATSNIGLTNINTISTFIMTNKNYDLGKYLKDVIIISLDDFINQKLFSYAKKYYTLNKQNPIAIKHNYYLTSDDFEIYKAILAMSTNVSLDEIKINNNDFYFLNNEQAQKRFLPSQLSNLVELLELCHISIDLNSPMDFVQYSKNSYSDLEKIAKTNLKKCFGDNKIYNERLEYELSIVKKLDFSNYFLTIHDYVQWAEDNNIEVGPGRGSAVGSLLAFCLNITKVDPIKYNLIFERFLNAGRKTMPDIDIDFEDEKRQLVIDYLFNKYENKVAHIVVFQRIKAKNAIRDIGRILGIDNKIINMISKTLFEDDFNNLTKESLEYKSKYPKLFWLANKILNFPRQVGLHAAGIVLSNNSLINKVPLFMQDNKIVTQFSMEYLEPLGVIKVDILGLTYLSILRQIKQYIYHDFKKNINTIEIPLSNDKTYQLLNNADTIGIFQLGSYGMRKLLKRMKIKNIEDVSLCLALYRPGPLQFIDEFITNRFNPSNVKYITPVFQKYLKDTSGIIIYQEQLMEIIKCVCNYNYSESDIFRRIISKKKPDELIKLKSNFIVAATKNNYSSEIANKIFSYIEKFAEYGFNHSHSIAYAHLTYWLCYFKANYPVYYYLSLLSNYSSSADKANEYVIDAKKHGISILYPSLAYSQANFSIVNNNIYYGYVSIKGIGYETALNIENIIASHKNIVDPIGIIMLLAKNKIDRSVIETLIYAGCFDIYITKEKRFYYIKNLETIFNSAKYVTNDGKSMFKPNLVEVKITAQDIKKCDEKFSSLFGIS